MVLKQWYTFADFKAFGETHFRDNYVAVADLTAYTFESNKFYDHNHKLQQFKMLHIGHLFRTDGPRVWARSNGERILYYYSREGILKPLHTSARTPIYYVKALAFIANARSAEGKRPSPELRMDLIEVVIHFLFLLAGLVLEVRWDKLDMLKYFDVVCRNYRPEGRASSLLVPDILGVRRTRGVGVSGLEVDEVPGDEELYVPKARLPRVRIMDTPLRKEIGLDVAVRTQVDLNATGDFNMEDVIEASGGNPQDTIHIESGAEDDDDTSQDDDPSEDDIEDSQTTSDDENDEMEDVTQGSVENQESNDIQTNGNIWDDDAHAGKDLHDSGFVEDTILDDTIFEDTHNQETTSSIKYSALSEDETNSQIQVTPSSAADDYPVWLKELEVLRLQAQQDRETIEKYEAILEAERNTRLCIIDYVEKLEGKIQQQEDQKNEWKVRYLRLSRGHMVEVDEKSPAKKFEI